MERSWSGCLTQREQRIARKIQETGGWARFEYCGPAWIPNSIQVRLPFLEGIEAAQIRDEHTERALADLSKLTHLKSLSLVLMKSLDESHLRHLEGLKNLESLNLRASPVTDANLKHLRGLVGLQTLDLSFTQITGAGLESLQSLTNLEELRLDFTLSW